MLPTTATSLVVFVVAQLVKNPPAMQFNPWVGKIPWRRERLPTPIFWPGEFHGLYSPWGRKESDTTEWLSLSLLHHSHSWDKDQRESYFTSKLKCHVGINSPGWLCNSTISAS